MAAPARTTPDIAARMTPSRMFIAPPPLPLLLELVAAFDPVRAPAQGTLFPCAVRLTGDGAAALVKLVFRLDATKTDPPPAPTAETSGAVKGTYNCGLSAPAVVPVVLVSGILAPDVFVFV